MKIRIQCRGPRSVTSQSRTRGRPLQLASKFLFFAGSLTLGFCASIYLESAWYQFFEGDRFETSAAFDPAALTLKLNRALPSAVNLPVYEGEPLSRIEIPRLGISLIVLEGVRPRDLTLGAGHVPGTALPGDSGNVAIAGHRDTFFRKLSEIRGHDRIMLTTLRGSFAYSVESMQIVDPDAVEVLQPTARPTLTLITCYPFSYVGPAPKRFIVKALREPDLRVEMEEPK